MPDAWLLSAAPTGATPDGRPTWRVPLVAFCAQVRPTYSGPGWDDVVAAMRADPDEWQVVTTLAPTAVAGFRRPVVVDPDDRDVANGMHRIVAALTAGATHLDVTDRYPAADEEQLHVELTLDWPHGHGYDDALDAAAALFRSFPVGDDWTESDVIAGHGPLISGYWYWPAGRAGELVAAMTGRAAARGAVVHVRTVELWDPDAEENEASRPVSEQA